MSLRDSILVLDCQTTGMHPSSGRILEIGWSLFSLEDEKSKIETWIVKGDEVPSKIRDITGITDEHLKFGEESAMVFEKWQSVMRALPNETKAVVHYAQFEKAFLNHWHQEHEREMTLDILCSHRIAKKLFPEIPSQNLRGLAGFFGGQLGELKRCASHIEATLVVWRAIVNKLSEQGIEDFESLQTWMKEKPKTKASPRYQYRMDRIARLALPNKPGIYRMLSKDGRILYVGKATSLRSRVNSYFRGQKGRDRRKLEMLAQVWDLKVTECETPLEAALLETDEIKKWDPPYNVSLKTGDRRLLFYSRNFEETSESQSADFPLGPFRPMNILESLRELIFWRETGEVHNIFYQEIDEAVLKAGFEIFCERGWKREDCDQWTMRQWLFRAALSYKQLLKDHPDRDLEEVLREQKDSLKGGPHPLETEEVLTPEQVAGKFDRLLIRCAMTLHRSHRLTRLRNADVRIPLKKGERRLVIRNGKIGLELATPVRNATPWAGADIADYDRMSILLSEIIKHSCTVE